jgi:hypothetical protein
MRDPITITVHIALWPARSAVHLAALGLSLWYGTGEWRGTCPRCGHDVVVPRGRLALRWPWKQATTWCQCGNMGDPSVVPVTRRRWL